MVGPSKTKVNSFASDQPTSEGALAARVQSLTCLLRLGRIIESADEVERVGSQVPDVLAEGLSYGEAVGVRLLLGETISESTGFVGRSRVCRRKILSRQQQVGEIEIHFDEGDSLSPEQEDLLDAVAERLARFCERKGLEWALERSEQRYQRLFRQARDGIVLVDSATGAILEANEFFLDMVGLGLDQLRSHRIWEIVSPEHRERLRSEFPATGAEQERRWLSLPLLSTQKGLVELEVSGSLIHFAGTEVLQFICRDITERQILTRRLRESENRYRAIFDSTPVAMISTDAQGVVLDVNNCMLSRFYRDLVTREDLIGRHVLELELIDLTGRQVEFMQFLRGVCVQLSDVPILESRYRGAGTANIRCTPLQDAQNKVQGGVVMIEDTTEMREAQRALIQATKMAVVGQMTSGIAHEIGTPLGIISANAQYLLKDPLNASCSDELSTILSETNRITNLIQQLLIFSRPAPFRLVPTVLNDVIRDTLHLMQNQEIMRLVEVKTDLSADIPLLPLEPNLIKQVFLNLIMNACQAMPTGGRLTIKSRTSPSQPGGHKNEPQVEVTFSDTGVGISGKNLRQVFTPFFTTKGVGKGSGLGLSVSYRIIQIHGGTIVAESRGEGRGATFRVFLPIGARTDNTTELTGNIIYGGIPGGGHSYDSGQETSVGRG